MFKAIALLALVCVVSASIEASITLNADSYKRGDRLIVDWNIKSNSGLGQAIRKHYTPLESGFHSNLFNIMTPNGIKAEYQGRLVKRAEPTVEDFEFVSTLHGKSGQHVISEGYRFYTAGEHSIVLSFTVNTLSGETYNVLSNVLTFVVEEEDINIPHVEEEDRTSITYLYCSTSQRNEIAGAASVAASSSANAYEYMTETCQSVYTTWFGDYSSTNWNTVRNCFYNIKNALAATYKVNCDCDERGVFAYVYPTDTSRTINVCNAFWGGSGNDCRIDSQPGTLTHEMSHFNAICGNDDIQYGTSGCQQLARTNPYSATHNADSYEYFQESCPQCGFF